MNETKHTAAPWTADGAAGIYSSDGACVAHVRMSAPIGYDEMMVNKRLIAAAPDLLALLKELIDIEGPQPGTAQWAEKVRAAIDKVEGRS